MAEENIAALLDFLVQTITQACQDAVLEEGAVSTLRQAQIQTEQIKRMLEVHDKYTDPNVTGAIPEINQLVRQEVELLLCEYEEKIRIIAYDIRDHKLAISKTERFSGRLRATSRHLLRGAVGLAGQSVRDLKEIIDMLRDIGSRLENIIRDCNQGGPTAPTTIGCQATPPVPSIYHPQRAAGPSMMLQHADSNERAQPSKPKSQLWIVNPQPAALSEEAIPAANAAVVCHTQGAANGFHQHADADDNDGDSVSMQSSWLSPPPTIPSTLKKSIADAQAATAELEAHRLTQERRRNKNRLSTKLVIAFQNALRCVDYNLSGRPDVQEYNTKKALRQADRANKHLRKLRVRVQKPYARRVELEEKCHKVTKETSDILREVHQDKGQW